MTTQSSEDERWMRRALSLAQRGSLEAWPNPMVGCVIVKGGAVLGEGWHERFGQPHAEVMAVNACQDRDALNGATAYVTLEPCSHHGKTPPCAQLLIDHGFARVVMAVEDPNPLVSGAGRRMLETAGIQVDADVCRPDATHLNRRFMHAMTSDVPWVTLKWAQSRDGFIDPDTQAQPGRGGIGITGTAAQQWTHTLRAQHDGILVGMNTLLVDSPKLTTRVTAGRSPRRFVLTRGQTPPPPHWQTDRSWAQGTTLLHPAKSPNMDSWTSLGFETRALHARALSHDWWREFKAAFGTQAILVEGGAQIHNSILREGLWHEMHVLESPKEFKQGLRAPAMSAAPATEAHALDSDKVMIWTQP